MSDITRDYSFGGLLSYYRREKGITLRDFSRIIGTDPGNLSKLERGELDPPKSAKKIREICDALGVEGLEPWLKSTAFQHHLSILKTKFDQSIEDDCESELAKQKLINQKLRKACEFYAQVNNPNDLGNWDMRKPFIFDIIEPSDCDQAHYDIDKYRFGGKRARQTLEEVDAIERGACD